MQETDLRSINLNLLVVLKALLDTSSVSGASQRLNLSQPAVSRSLAQLRDLFDDALFIRASRGLIPTSRAEDLAAPLSDLLRSTVDLLSEVTFDPTNAKNIFRVSTTDYGATAVLAPVLETFLANAPNAGLEVLPFADTVFGDLAAGDVDLALYSDDEPPAHLCTRELFVEDYVCLVRRGHPIVKSMKQAPEEPIDLDEFLAWPHALVTVFGGRSGIVDRALNKLGKQRHIALWIPYFSVAPLMISESDAILVIPSRVATAFQNMKTLVALRAPIEIEQFGYRLLWHERNDKDQAQAWLRELIANTLASKQRSQK